LADRYRVVALDLRGHGRSTAGSAGFGLDRLADDIAEALTMLDLRDAIVVGHSMGGMALLRFARRHRSLLDDRVAGLVLVATTADPVLGFGSSTAFRGLAGVLRIPGERIGWGRVPAYRPGADDFNFGIVRLSFGADAAPRHVEVTRQMLAAMDREAFHRSFLGLLDNDELDHLAAIDLPTTVVVGSRDLLTPPRVARRLAAAIPGAELVVVDGAGHQLMLERPAELASVIDTLVARVEASRSAASPRDGRGVLRR
jgi:pimeloyl-ACP methyl ester carboxylesterase